MIDDRAHEDRVGGLLAGPRGREACMRAAGTASPAVEALWNRACCGGYETKNPQVALELAAALREVTPAAAAALDGPRSWPGSTPTRPGCAMSCGSSMSRVTGGSALTPTGSCTYP